MKELLKKLMVEFIGTFFLVLTIGCCVLSANDGVIAPIAIGFALMVMVYAGGHVSGGHYNPAVSVAATIRGALNWGEVIPYWIAQFLGGSIAALVVKQLVVTPEMAEPAFDLCTLVCAELLFTFALCYVVLHCATSKANEGNSFYGLAIGSTVTVGAFATAGLCFGAFNPAVALGLGILSIAGCKFVCVTLGANLLAGVIAGFVYKITSND